jgi:exodeoxyribonuclease V alpha subunit
VEAFITRYEIQERAALKNPGFSLSEAQKDAVRSFVTEKILIITGGPGTGKTQIVKALVQLMKENNISFELLTPTGIAAKKLGSTAGCEAYTIHRRLGYKGDRWDNNALNKYSTQAVVADEMSMVDQEVFFRLLSALYSSTRFVFVGDNDQLPSVGPGSVLKELIESKEIKTVFLDKIFRQDACSDIIKEAKKIRDGDTDLSLFSTDKTKDIWHIREKVPEKIEQTIIKFAQQLKERAKVSGNALAFQIITPRNQGPLSVDTLNVALQEALNPPDKDKKEIRLNHSIIRKGDRIMVRKNNYELGVFNGDIGKVVFVTMDNVVVDLEDFYAESRRVEIPMKFADEMIKLAYAITCHKSQGLEYPLVIMPFIKAHGTLLLQRNLLYTAITRAKKKVIILGQASAIESAIQNDKIQRRNTRFAERIKEWMQGKGISMRDMYSGSSGYQNAAVLDRLLLLENQEG